MNNMVTKWEDEENNRNVQYSVNYTIESDGIEIVDVTPRQVDFVGQERSVGVHTTKGRIHLAEKIKQSGHIDLIKQQIANKEGLLTNA